MSTAVVNTMEAFGVVPSGGALGAEVRGLDLSRPLPKDVADARGQGVERISCAAGEGPDSDRRADHRLRPAVLASRTQPKGWNTAASRASLRPRSS